MVHFMLDGESVEAEFASQKTVVTVLAAVGGVIGLIGVLYSLLVTKDTPENQAKLKSASDMVKMFGGFFACIATTLLAPH